MCPVSNGKWFRNTFNKAGILYRGEETINIYEIGKIKILLHKNAEMSSEFSSFL